MVRLRALAHGHILHLDEIADVRIFPDHRAGPQPRIRPHDRARAHARAFKVRERADHRAAGNTHARREHHVRFDGHTRRDLRVMAEIHRLRRRHRHALRHQTLTYSLLENPLDPRQLRLAVHAQHITLLAMRHRRLEPAPTRQPNQIGEIILALRVVVLHLFQKLEHQLHRRSHHARIRQLDLQLLFARIVRLDDGFQRPILRRHQPPIAIGQLRLEPQHADASALVDLRKRPLARLLRHKRRIRIQHDSLPLDAAQRPARRFHRVRRAHLLALHNHILRPHQLGGGLRQRRHIRPHHDNAPLAAQRLRQRHAPRQHRPPADLVQHLRARRFHPRPLAGGEDDCETVCHGFRPSRSIQPAL